MAARLHRISTADEEFGRGGRVEQPPEPDPDVELRKQISLFVPLSEWRLVRNEAARQRIPITELLRRWIKPEMMKLKNPGPQKAA